MIIGGIGLATQAFGLFEGANAQEDAARAQANTNRQMAVITQQETAVKRQGIAAQSALNKAEVRASRQQEVIRKQMMELSARRSFRELVRQNQVARANALTVATNQGVGTQSSTLGGAYGAIQGQGNAAGNELYQNLQFGRKNFKINQDLFSAQSRYATTAGRINQTLATLEGKASVVQATGQAGVAQAQGDAALGQSLFSFGQSLVNNAPTMRNIGQTIGVF